jgi:ABC-type oligopeptide transport system substrate-binding subunit/DNA-binding SARP family transcriptional activator
MPALRLFLLGPLDIRHDGQQLPKPPTVKSQSLLAYLALHRERPLLRERLADLFWGDRPERRARRSLATALWHIRRCLPDDSLLVSDVQSAQFDPQADLWLDVEEFESLVARPDTGSLQFAVELYRGEFMEGFYDDWALNERYRLETTFSEALARLMTGLELQGRAEDALATALRLLRHDPLREDAHRVAMRAFCRLGQRNAALEQYHRCQEIVQQELGAEPMSETTVLYQEILDGRFEIGPAPEIVAREIAAVASAVPHGHNPLDPLTHFPLVGREVEMAFLRDCFEKARAGRGGLVMVSGEAGVGKTRLIEELATQLRWQGVRVLWGRCYEFERLLPYQPIGEALQAVLSTTAPSELARLPSWILSELVRLVPELPEKVPGLPDSETMPPDNEQTYLFQGVARFLASLSTGGPLVLILDDLHWATESTLQMVHYLARHLADHQVLMVGTLRPEAVGPRSALDSLQRQLGKDGVASPLHLSGLSSQAIQAMMVQMSGCGEAVAPLARRLYQETEGNPFFLIEIVKALFEAELVSLDAGIWRADFAELSEAVLPLPGAISEAIEARLRPLDESAQQALRVGAILGREFDFDLLHAVWGEDEEVTLEALDTLLRRRFVDEGSGVLGRDYAFHHHKIREVVYAAIPVRHRQHLHGQAGKAMEMLYESNLEAVAGELAFHFGQGRQVDKALAPKVVRYLLLAGDQARLAYAHQEAIQYYSEALALQKEPGEYEQAARTLMKLGLTYHTSFDFARAHTAFQEGFAQWQQAGRGDSPLSRPPAPHALRIRWRCPYTLDPALCGEYVSSLVINQVFSGLVSTSPDLDIVPEVAQRWEVFEGGRRYRFYLRPDALWSDGTRVTAHDFEYAWKRVLHPGTGADASDVLAIKGAPAFHQGDSEDADQVGVRALDDGTLEVELEEPVSHFLYVLTHHRTFPVPRHLVSTFGEAWTDSDRIVTNGPFRPEAWDRDSYMRLVRNPSYACRRRGNVEQVVLHFPQDLATQDLSAPLEQYVRGDLDVLTLTDASVYEGDRIRRQFASEYLSAPWLFVLYLGFVTSRPPFDDMRLRQALALAANREELANVVLRGMYPPGTGGFVPPGMPGHSPHSGFPYHPERARQLLAAAGHAGGAALPALEGLSVPPIDPLLPQYLQAQWQENLGIEVVWHVADWPPFRRRLQEDPPHLYLLAGFAAWPDPSSFLEPHVERERTRWASQAYEERVERARHTLDQQVRIEFLRQADEILVQEAPIVPLHYGRQHILVKPWVSSFPISALNHWYWKDTVLEPH